MSLIGHFAIRFFGFEADIGVDGEGEEGQVRRVIPAEWYVTLSPETARVIASVASGGPAGAYRWHELFLDEQKRRVVVCAIVGNVLVEQVFQHIFFGGEKQGIDTVSALQGEWRLADGFDRNRQYAKAITNMVWARHEKVEEPFILPANFNNHVNTVVAGLYTHLAPFLHLSSSNKKKPTLVVSELSTPLQKIMTFVGLVSLHMRTNPHKVYYFVPTFKEDTFSSETTECFNVRFMQQRNPQTALSAVSPIEQARRAALSDAEKKRVQNDSPLTQITIYGRRDGVLTRWLGNSF